MKITMLFQDPGEDRKAFFIFRTEPVFDGTVKIQYPDNLSVPRMKRDHDLRGGSAVAGDMAGKKMDVGYPLDLVLFG